MGGFAFFLVIVVELRGDSGLDQTLRVIVLRDGEQLASIMFRKFAEVSQRACPCHIKLWV